MSKDANNPSPYDAVPAGIDMAAAHVAWLKYAQLRAQYGQRPPLRIAAAMTALWSTVERWEARVTWEEYA